MDMDGLGGLVAFVVGWFFAQSAKLLGDMARMGRPLKKTELIDSFLRSGGMPSGHTASFLALTTFLGVQNGFLSQICVLSLCVSIIVVYDAINVRYAVGEQGKMLNVIAMDHNYKKNKVKVVEGHTVSQVIVGAIIGIAFGLLVGFAFK